MRTRESRARLVLLWIACSALSGCAGMSAGVVRDDTNERGYRYYAPAPFLFVRSDGKGGLTSEIVYLPDTTQKLTVRPYAVLAANNATLSFTNGMLTEASVVGDETAVPIGFLDALTKAASAAIAADLPAGSDAKAPVPYLYRIVVQGTTVKLTGGPATGADGNTATIYVSVAAQAGK